MSSIRRARSGGGRRSRDRGRLLWAPELNSIRAGGRAELTSQLALAVFRAARERVRNAGAAVLAPP